mmetsp:Transcript_106568/g.296548  ORF Transcript_106568/g.296548 Transcript_106568/m.296548 type:complete len:211 (-) Transcript_106568:104-736(-)
MSNGAPTIGCSTPAAERATCPGARAATVCPGACRASLAAGGAGAAGFIVLVAPEERQRPVPAFPVDERRPRLPGVACSRKIWRHGGLAGRGEPPQPPPAAAAVAAFSLPGGWWAPLAADEPARLLETPAMDNEVLCGTRGERNPLTGQPKDTSLPERTTVRQLASSAVQARTSGERGSGWKRGVLQPTGSWSCSSQSIAEPPAHRLFCRW